MPLHPTIAAFLASLPPSEPGPIDPAALRADEASHVPPVAERLPIRFVSDGDLGGVPVRMYSDVQAERLGTIVYVHGGAFFLGSLDTHDHIARELAKATGKFVISVGYRLAPEHAFPAGLDDVVAVVKEIVANGRAAGWDGETLALVGDSSGGNFVAAAVARLHDEGVDAVTHQVLYYPSVDLDFDESRWPSLTENAVGYGLETAGLGPFNAFYLDSGADPADPLVSPIKRADLSGLPPALIVTAEYDPLRDEGEAYAAKLEAAGVPVTLHRIEGAGHGFVQHFGWVPELHGVYAETAAFLAARPLSEGSDTK